jgi:general secretion pathway protein D
MKISRVSIVVPALVLFLSNGVFAGQPPPAGQDAPAGEAPAEPQTRPTPFGQTPLGVPQNVPEAAPVDPAAEQEPDPNAAAEPEPQAVEPEPGEASPISLQLDNADIYQVIRIIGDALELNYVIDPAVAGTVNISTSDTLEEADLLPILESILQINGATMIRTGNFYRIVPIEEALGQPLPLQGQIEGAANSAALFGDELITQIVRLRFVAAAEITTILEEYLSTAGHIVSHEPGGILLLTERRSNVVRLLELVEIFDSAGFAGERVRLYEPQSSSPEALAADLETVFAGLALSSGTSSVRFIPLTRIGSILVVTPSPEVFPEVERWMERLDQAEITSASGRRNFVHRLRNAKASDVRSVIAQLYGAAAPVPQDVTTPQQLQQQQLLQEPGAAEGQVLGQAQGQTNVFAQDSETPQVSLLGQGVRIISDPINNALVIQATEQEYAEIAETINQLDVMPRQVLIDAQIYEVDLDDSLTLGISAALQNRPTRNPANPIQTTASFPGEGGVGFAAETFAFVGRTRELVAFLNATENRSRVRTLSAPTVLASDNTPATFQVGADVPVPVTSSVTPVQSDGSNLFAQTITFRTTGVILNVTPQIGEETVTLEISQEVSQAGANTTSDIVAPVIGKSSVTSKVVVGDGETIALGGFIRENSDRGQSRVPIIGRIPGLGALFGSTTRSDTRTELIILITPHVLADRESARIATDELKARLREIQEGFPEAGLAEETTAP